MALNVTTEPTIEPITTAEAKLHLNIASTDTEQDGYIASLISAARSFTENTIKRALITQTLKLTLDSFPSERIIELERAAPLQSVTSITYNDANGDSQTLASSKYKSDTSSTPGRVQLKSGESWPTTEDAIASVEITYTAGYGSSPIKVPKDLKQGMLTLIAHWFENREAHVVMAGVSQVEVPDTYQRAVYPFRVGL